MSMNGAPKIEKREIPNRPRFKTFKREVLETKRDKFGNEVRMETSDACNGSYHRRVIEDVTYDADGMVTYATTIQQEGLGPCDSKHD